MTNTERNILIALIRCALCDKPTNATLHQIDRLRIYYLEMDNQDMFKRITDLLKPNLKKYIGKLVQSDQENSAPLEDKKYSEQDVRLGFLAGYDLAKGIDKITSKQYISSLNQK